MPKVWFLSWAPKELLVTSNWMSCHIFKFITCKSKCRFSSCLAETAHSPVVSTWVGRATATRKPESSSAFHAPFCPPLTHLQSPDGSACFRSQGCTRFPIFHYSCSSEPMWITLVTYQFSHTKICTDFYYTVNPTVSKIQPANLNFVL
jgi:hypothetical protein